MGMRNVLKKYVAVPRYMVSETDGAANITAQVASLAYVSSLSQDVDLCAPLPGIIGEKDVAEVCGAFGWSKDIAMHGASCADVKSLYDRYNLTSAGNRFNNTTAPAATFADMTINVDPNTPIAGLWYEQV